MEEKDDNASELHLKTVSLLSNISSNRLKYVNRFPSLANPLLCAMWSKDKRPSRHLKHGVV